MDLGAFAQIGDLEKIMTENGISVPRLRGLRLMQTEKPLSIESMKKDALFNGLFCCEQACCSDFKYNAGWSEWSCRTERIRRKYIAYDKNKNATGIKWGNIHGKKRKLFKYIMKKERKKVYKNSLLFNKYCGRDDVLYIHARIGGGNWPYYRGEVEHQPWFIEKIDDAFDSTYCDIYAKIKPIENVSSHSEQSL